MRQPRYGELGVVNLVSEVKVLWFTRDKELPELPSWRWAHQHQTDPTQEDRIDFMRRLVELTPLTDREREAIELHVLMDYTLDEAAEHFGCTRERVRQIVSKGFRKFRAKERLMGSVRAWDLLGERLPPEPAPRPKFIDPLLPSLVGRGGYWF